MNDWFKRLMAGGLLGAQVLLLAVVPSADARLEADALEPHSHGTASPSDAGFHPAPSRLAPAGVPSAEAGSTSREVRDRDAELHASHPSHDHLLCDLCRALSVLGGPAPAPEGVVRLAHRPLTPAAIHDQRPVPSPLYLPVGPRAPPA